jgi:purine-binding chemotaxis protein CheW
MPVEAISEVRPYLTFKLASDIFALDVATVREVLDFTTITKIPRTPEYMRGVINLRGSVVPVLDLRRAFNMPPTEKTVNSCIIVVEVAIDGERIVIGALADSVEEVLEMEPDQIQPAPSIGTAVNTEVIRGMGRRESEFVMILDIDRVFGSGELEAVRQAVA